jgi:putative transposase
MPWTIEWLSDNGSCYIAGDTRSFAHDPGLEPRVTPIIKMAEAFVRTIKRDYIRIIRAPMQRRDATTLIVVRSLQ